MKKTAIFGASGGGQKVAQTFDSFGIAYDCFIDNNKAKWGGKNGDTKILPPTVLKDEDYQILIASEHQAEIEQQLEQMGLLDRLVLKEDLILPFVSKQKKTIKKEYNEKQVSLAKERTVIIDLSEGVQLGGIETWSYMVASMFQTEQIPVEVWAKKTKMEPPAEIAALFRYYPIEYHDFSNNVLELARELIKKAPVSVLINKQTQLMYAAMLAKEICGEEAIRIVSVIHSDNVAFYRRHKYLEKYLDHICCVSKRIWELATKKYNINSEKITYKITPIQLDEDEEMRCYTLDSNQPLQIGYAGRIEVNAKRVDLILPLMEELEKYDCNYHLSLAGDGRFLKQFKEVTKEKGWTDRVTFLGKIPHRDIKKFWMDKDVFLSVSEFEGSSMAALEAMSCGAIPVETNVSGVEELVLPGVNGYYAETGDVNKLARYIYDLDQHREDLKKMGQAAYEVIKKKCNPMEYVADLRKWLMV